MYSILLRKDKQKHLRTKVKNINIFKRHFHSYENTCNINKHAINKNAHDVTSNTVLMHCLKLA